MASTLNLFALDRDSPASRQLHVVVEDNAEYGKKENRLLVTDNKAVAELKEVNTSVDHIKSILTKTKRFYDHFNLFSDTVVQTDGTGNTTLTITDAEINNISDEDITLSRFVNVSDVDKINIYYRDTIEFNPADVTLQDYVVSINGIIGDVSKNDGIFNDLLSIPALLTNNRVEFAQETDGNTVLNVRNVSNTEPTITQFNQFSIVKIGNFVPSGLVSVNNDGTSISERTFDFIDLNVNGITAIFLKVDPVGILTTDGETKAEDAPLESPYEPIQFFPTAVVSGQFDIRPLLQFEADNEQI